VAAEEAVENAVSNAGLMAGNRDREAGNDAGGEHEQRPGGIEACLGNHTRGQRKHADRCEPHDELRHLHHHAEYALPEIEQGLPVWQFDTREEEAEQHAEEHDTQQLSGGRGFQDIRRNDAEKRIEGAG
jgi:hypothetical protein